MTNLWEKARTGRIKALEERAQRRAIPETEFRVRARYLPEPRDEAPIFMSSRSRELSHALLH